MCIRGNIPIVVYAGELVSVDTLVLDWLVVQGLHMDDSNKANNSSGHYIDTHIYQ